MNGINDSYTAYETLVLSAIAHESHLTKAQIQQKIFEVSNGYIDLTMRTLSEIISRLRQSVAIERLENEQGEGIFSITVFGQHMLSKGRFEHWRYHKGADEVLKLAEEDHNSSAYENCFKVFLSGTSYENAQGMLYTVVREAYSLGWNAGYSSRISEEEK